MCVNKHSIHGIPWTLQITHTHTLTWCVFVCRREHTHRSGDKTPLTPPSCMFFLCHIFRSFACLAPACLVACLAPTPKLASGPFFLSLSMETQDAITCMLEAPRIMNQLIGTLSRAWHVCGLYTRVPCFCLWAHVHTYHCMSYPIVDG